MNGQRGLRIALPVLIAVLFLAGWEAAVRIEGIAPYILPSPSAVAQSLWTDGPSLFGSLLVTLDHARGTGGGRVDRRRAGHPVFTVANSRTKPLSLCRDPAGHADRRDCATDYHMGAAAVSGVVGLRLDRCVLSDRVEHDGWPQ